MKYVKNIFYFLFLGVLTASCLEVFTPASSENYGYLVVDASINSATGEGTVKLTRTIPLNSSDPVVQVTGAQISLEDESGNENIFSEINNGVYHASGLPISVDKKYRLNIKTSKS